MALIGSLDQRVRGEMRFALIGQGDGWMKMQWTTMIRWVAEMVLSQSVDYCGDTQWRYLAIMKILLPK